MLFVSTIATFAQSFLRDVDGVPNFRVVNSGIYRGGQPTREGFENLARLGVKTILDVREDGDRVKDEEKLVKKLGMRYVSVPMKGMTTPSDKQISKALRVLKDADAGPVFVHCKKGVDRTGAVVACYRIQHDGLSNGEALAEARGLGMKWYQFQIQRYVATYRPHDDNVFKRIGRAASEAIEKITP